MFPIAISHFSLFPEVISTVPMPVGTPDRPGGFLYMTRPESEAVQCDLRLFNRGDLDLGPSWGTKIPVVREDQFADMVELLNVPTRTEFRSAMHVYGLPDGTDPEETVIVRIYSYRGELLASAELPLSYTSPRHAAILSLLDRFPEIRPAPDRRTGMENCVSIMDCRVRVHLQSSSGKVKLWAIIGVVSNSTQNVTIVTPD